MAGQNPFDPEERGLQRYIQLGRDIKDQSERLFDSLPLFVRIVMTEKGGSSRWKEFNKFDLINPVQLDDGFGKRTSVFNDYRFDSKIFYQPGSGKKQKLLSCSEFLQAVLLKTPSDAFSVQEFILSIAYHRGIHNSRDDPRLTILYNDFIIPNHEISFSLLIDVARTLYDAFEEVFLKFSLDNNFFTREHGFQPQTVENGKIIRAPGTGQPAIRFNRSYLQGPIRACMSHGLRISTKLSLLEKSKKTRFLFAYGHREKRTPSISCMYAGDQLIATASSVQGNESKSLKTRITPILQDSLFILEVALYPTGEFILGINEKLIESSSINTSFSVYNGKFILGADLDGVRNGSFLQAELSIENITKQGWTKRVFSSALRRLPPYSERYLAPDMEDRATQIGNKLS